jgi:hypothetical protein
VCLLLSDGGLLLCSGGVSFWSVLGLFLGNDLFIGNDNNGVVFSLGSVSRWYFLWGPFRGGIFFGVQIVWWGTIHSYHSSLLSNEYRGNAVGACIYGG